MLNLYRMDEKWPQMGDVFQEAYIVVQGDVIEYNKVLMNLSHITYVRYDGNPSLFGHQAYRQKFRYATDPYHIGLTKGHGTTL